MEMIIIDNYILIEKSFRFLNQKKFRFHYGSYLRDVKQLNKLLFFLKYDYSFIDIPTFSAVKEATPFDSEDILSFNPESIYCNAVYSLYLNKDNSYKLLFSNSLIYEGTWLKYDNILSLYDTMFDFTFFLIIKGKDLINISLYGYDDEFILTLKE
ncbi:MAG: hypothetical protein LBQ22_00760 [Bacteroidales bacterium]|jgi:hypothetical protein|nr:hypothetical protein [Bacteroidales bacterium]